MMLDDQQTGCGDFEDEAERRNRADHAPHAEAVAIVPDGEMDPRALDGRSNARQHRRLQRQRRVESQRMNGLVG